ncbi:MAG: hypothetical protein JW778_03760 [Candidatus Altiarchaeota archaeon]|nr:hypothetical protein [Candidatus Altiarchaeota archaeon]
MKLSPKEVLVHRGIRDLEQPFGSLAHEGVVSKKFASVRNMGDSAHGSPKGIRPQLGDFEHINLLNLRRFSLSYVSPEQEHEVYKIGRIIGAYLAKIDAESPQNRDLFDKNSGRDFWGIIGDKALQEDQRRTWKNLGIGFIGVERIDRKHGVVKYSLDESPSSVVHKRNTPCFMEAGILSGMVESLYTISQRDVSDALSVQENYPVVELSLLDKGENPPIDPPAKGELESMLFETISLVLDEAEACRRGLPDFSYMALDQMINYLFLTLSPGHIILSKQAGRICGERISREANLSGVGRALDFLQRIFLYLRAGIIHAKEGINQITVSMDESVYASGVDNVGINLCTFFEGILEGTLSKATDQRWYVLETKCAGNDHLRCEFNCRLADYTKM